jgi:hypothetical protein
MRTSSRSICAETTGQAGSVFGVMSAKTSVEMTVMVKLGCGAKCSPAPLVRRPLDAAPDGVDHTCPPPRTSPYNRPVTAPEQTEDEPIDGDTSGIILGKSYTCRGVEDTDVDDHLPED